MCSEILGSKRDFTNLRIALR